MCVFRIDARFYLFMHTFSTSPLAIGMSLPYRRLILHFLMHQLSTSPLAIGMSLPVTTGRYASGNNSPAHWRLGCVFRIEYGQTFGFNQPIGDWDVSSVSTLGFYLSWCKQLSTSHWRLGCVFRIDAILYLSIMQVGFNQPIGDWDVSSVSTLYSTFGSASQFNQPIGDWDVSSVSTLAFYLSTMQVSFNQPIGDWDVSSVSTYIIPFQFAPAFNQPIGDWDVSSYRRWLIPFMVQVFQPAHWRLGCVFRIDAVFYFSLVQPSIQPAHWRLGCVFRIDAILYLFNSASHFNQPIGDWDVSSVSTLLNSTFYYAKDFNQPIGDWDVSSVSTLIIPFMMQSQFNQPIGDWDVSSVSTLYYTFYYAKAIQPAHWRLGCVFRIDAGSDLSWCKSISTSPLAIGMCLPYRRSIIPFIEPPVSTSPLAIGMCLPYRRYLIPFQSASHFNQPIGDWDVSSVSTLVKYLLLCKSIQPAHWRLGCLFRIDAGSYLFSAISFNQPLFCSPSWVSTNASSKPLHMISDTQCAPCSSLNSSFCHAPGYSGNLRRDAQFRYCASELCGEM